MIFIIDDDRIMANCIKRAAKADAKIFSNAIEAMAEISNGVIPDLIFLDILLDGPDGFTFLNELSSYDDTNKIPIVIVSSLSLAGEKLNDYGVVGILNKDEMMPEEIKGYVEKYVR